MEIFNANKDVLSDPTRSLGQVLKIPEHTRQ